MRLTDKSIPSLPLPEKGQKDYRDDTLKGFHVRVSQGGSRTFYLMHSKARSRTKIGVYPIISLRQARQKARELLAEQTLGRNRPKSITFADAVAQFLENYTGRKPRTVYDTTQILRRYFLPPLRHERLGDITSYQITRIIDRLRDKPTSARHALAVIKMFFSWCVSREYVENSPCERLQPPQKPRSRARVLNDEELGKVLLTAQETRFPFGQIVLLLALTGQRRGEIAGLQWDYIEADKINLPPELCKNNTAHTFPIGTWAQEIISSVPHRNNNPFLFPSWSKRATGKFTNLEPLLKPFANWANPKETFDKKCPIPHWTLHDLRRTFSTNMAKLGTPIHVTEKLLNHVSGSLSGVQAIYNRHTYMDEMRDAIHDYEKHLKLLCS